MLSDPRRPATSTEHAAKQALLATLKSETVAMLDAVQAVKKARSDLAAQRGSDRRAGALDRKLENWLNVTVEANDRHFIDPGHSSERLDFNLLAVIGMVDNMDAPITAGLSERVADVRAEWAKRRAEYLALAAETTALGMVPAGAAAGAP